MIWQLGLRVAVACGVLLPAYTAAADGKKDDAAKPALTGTWAKKDGHPTLEFGDKGVVKFHPHGDKADIAVACTYTVEKDGVVKVKVTAHEGKDDLKEKLKGVVPVGLEFSFQWTVKGDAATLDGVDGKDVEGLKSHLEGEYEKK